MDPVIEERYKKLQAEVVKRYNLKIDLPDPPEYDPIMIDIVFFDMMFEDLRNDLNEVFELARQRYDDMAHSWTEREKQAWDDVNREFETLIEKNTESLNSVFLSAMRKAIAEGNSGLENKVQSVCNAFVRQTNRLSLTSVLLTGLLGVNLLLEMLKLFNFL